MHAILPISGTVYITGAGPGDPDLMTVKAVRVLSRAGIVFYDRLIDTGILDLASASCERVYVGKEDGKHKVPQDEINQLLVQAARRHEVVVRLKGGDPFLFGRGGEEAQELAKAGIRFEIIPGVTSALSVPAYAGIPITHRGLASHCTFITGHLSAQRAEEIPWSSFNHRGTLVFLMSVASRQEIARRLIAHGRPATQPVAFVERGTTDQQRVWTGTLQEVAENPPKVGSPSLMVVGDVVQLREQIQWFDKEVALPVE